MVRVEPNKADVISQLRLGPDNSVYGLIDVDFLDSEITYNNYQINMDSWDENLTYSMFDLNSFTTTNASTWMFQINSEEKSFHIESYEYGINATLTNTNMSYFENWALTFINTGNREAYYTYYEGLGNYPEERIPVEWGYYTMNLNQFISTNPPSAPVGYYFLFARLYNFEYAVNLNTQSESITQNAEHILQIDVNTPLDSFTIIHISHTEEMDKVKLCLLWL